MPRNSNRGGTRTGTPGQSYSNRTDLNQPKQAATGQAYGQAGQQLAAQAVVPLPNSQAQTAALAQNAQAVSQQQPVAGQGDPIFPGELGDFHRPTDRPGEPLTHGSPLGPGAGPEAIPMINPQPNLPQTIASIAQQSGNASIMALAQKAAQQQGANNGA